MVGSATRGSPVATLMVRSRPLRDQPTAWSHGAPSEWRAEWPLRVPARRLWNHQLDERRFGYLRDDTNYLAS